MIKKQLYILFLILFLFSTKIAVFSQSGIRFPEFEKKLEAYFNSELIDDIKKQIPPESNLNIWSWDVGDFSGDNVYDLCFVIRLNVERKRVAHVFFFVDIDGFLTKVYQAPFEYVELPLEIGITIKNNICYVTQKQKQFDWKIFGYTFINGNFLQIDEFSTERSDKYTIETYRNYLNLRNYEKYINTNNNKLEFKKDYLAIPSYQRKKVIFYGYPSEAKSNYIEYIPAGAYYWNDENDCSFSVISAYDNENLYFTVKVIDDVVIGTDYKTQNSEFVEIWLDFSDICNNRAKQIQKNKFSFVKEPDSLFYQFVVYPGDFYEKSAFVKEINTTDDLDQSQVESLKSIKVLSSLTKNGYEIKIKIPFSVFGFISLPFDENDITEIGCTIVVNDIDNSYRPEEATKVATSAFSEKNIYTLGTLVFIPNNSSYGNVTNIYKFDIIKHLNDFGF